MMQKSLYILLVPFLLFFSLDVYRAGVFYSSASDISNIVDADPVVSAKKANSNVAHEFSVETSGLHVSLCSGCQYNGEYNKIRDAVFDQLPQIDVTFSEYPLAFWRAAVGYVLSALKIGVMIMGFAGQQVLDYFNIRHPSIEKIMQSRFYFIAAWYVLGFVQGSISNSGAFEIFFDGNQIFSKLESGQFPDTQQLIAVVRAIIGDDI